MKTKIFEFFGTDSTIRDPVFSNFNIFVLKRYPDANAKITGVIIKNNRIKNE